MGMGTRFAERYHVEALLGTGAMGSVYRVRDDVVGEVVALKLLNDASVDGDALERHRLEVRLARRVTHRNVARTYDLGEWRGQHYLTMEYVEGVSLRDRLRERGRLDVAEVLEVGEQIARGLAAAHAAGVVHRDLKPANVLIQVGGRVVITDFGIAGTHGGDAREVTALIGTPAYMAPEQVSGEALGPGTDLYALGLILYELLTGALPFEADSVLALALVRLSQVPRVHDHPAIPKVLAPILAQLLEREPEARLSDATALVHRLRNAASLLEPSSVSLAVDHRTIAVLPFRHHGPAEQRHVSESLGDELIDVLTTMKGLCVSAAGATARFAELGNRDPRAVGEELGVELIVNASATVSGERIRIAARLIEVASGSQIWSDRFDGSLGDVFGLQETMGRRIGEALRLELEHWVHAVHVPDAAMDEYLRARAAGRNAMWGGPEGAVTLYQRCLAIAPEFKPALAGYAFACIRAWFMPSGDKRDFAELGSLAVEGALVGAPELAETHLAVGMRAVQLGDYREAASALHQALQIAPTYAAAHDYLGRLQLEAGMPEQGVRHVELALELDPTLVWCLRDLARYHALRGDREQCEYWWQRLGPTAAMNDLLRMQEMRFACYFNDREWIRRVAEGHRWSELARSLVAIYTTDLDEPALLQLMDRALVLTGTNPRGRTVRLQSFCEGAAWKGLDALSLRFLIEAADAVLVDVDWMDRCPLLDRLRPLEEFARARQQVEARARAIWGI